MIYIKKVLPFCDNPSVKTYPYIAFYLSILEGNGINVENLIIKEFSHVFFFRGKLDFVASGVFHKKFFYFKPIKFHVKKHINNLINEINKGHYVVLILNEKYINNTKVSVDFDFPHDWLVYGYDSKEKMFYCAGYFERSGLRRYETTKLSYMEVEKSLKKCSFFNNYAFSSKDTHSTWIKKAPEIEIDNQYLKNVLYKFLNPPKILFYHRPIPNLDIKAVLLLKKSIIKKISNWEKLKTKKLWAQSYRVLYENIDVLKLIGENYIDNIQINEELKNLSIKSYLLLLLVGKYNLNPQKKTLTKIVNYLDIIYLQEKKILISMIECI